MNLSSTNRKDATKLLLKVIGEQDVDQNEILEALGMKPQAAVTSKQITLLNRLDKSVERTAEILQSITEAGVNLEQAKNSLTPLMAFALGVGAGTKTRRATKTVATISVDPNAPKRGRGRPAGIKNIAVIKAEADPNAPKRGRGRPAGSKNTAVIKVEADPNAPKRGRGRPAGSKNVKAVGTVETIETVAPVATPPKQKVARVKKTEQIHVSENQAIPATRAEKSMDVKVPNTRKNRDLLESLSTPPLA